MERPRQAGKPTRLPEEVTARPGSRVHPAAGGDPGSWAYGLSELGLEDNEQVVSRHQERSIDGTPWSLQTSFYPMSLVERRRTRLIAGLPTSPSGAVAYLAERCGIKQAGYRDSITVRAPNETETGFSSSPTTARIAGGT